MDAKAVIPQAITNEIRLFTFKSSKKKSPTFVVQKKVICILALVVHSYK